jgi:hypothetical protein
MLIINQFFRILILLSQLTFIILFKQVHLTNFYGLIQILYHFYEMKLGLFDNILIILTPRLFFI